MGDQENYIINFGLLMPRRELDPAWNPAYNPVAYFATGSMHFKSSQLQQKARLLTRVVPDSAHPDPAKLILTPLR